MSTRLSRIAITALSAAALLFAGDIGARASEQPTSSADADPGHCTDDSRDCVMETAFTYLNALISHDVDSVRLAPDVWRMNNGHVAARGDDELRGAIGVEPVGDWSSMRWIVDGQDAVVVYDLDSDFTRLAQSETFGPAATWVPAYIAERFHVEGGLIHEIEVVYWGDPTHSPRPERPLRSTSFPSGPCSDGSPACQIETAGSYLHALETHDALAVPLAPDAWRLELGRNTGDSGDAIRGSVESPIMDVIIGLDDVRWFVEGDQAVAFYTLWADGTGLVGPPAGPPDGRTPAFVVERFRIQDGLIKEIEAVFWIDPPGSKPDQRPS